MRLLFSAGAALLLIVSGSVGGPGKARPATFFEARLHAQAVRAIKLATVVPEGSVWDRNLKQMAEEWKQATGGRVTVTVFGGGSQGDEATVLRKMRLDALQAGVVHHRRPRQHRCGVQRVRRAVLLRVVRRAELRHREADARHRQAPRRERVRAPQLGSRRVDAAVHQAAGADARGSQDDQAVHVGGERPHGPVVQGQRLRAASRWR